MIDSSEAWLHSFYVLYQADVIDEYITPPNSPGFPSTFNELANYDWNSKGHTKSRCCWDHVLNLFPKEVFEIALHGSECPYCAAEYIALGPSETIAIDLTSITISEATVPAISLVQKERQNTLIKMLRHFRKRQRDKLHRRNKLLLETQKNV